MYSVAYKTRVHMKKIGILLFFTILIGKNLDQALEIAGENRLEIKKAIKAVPDDQLEGMEWLITHMPDEDLKSLSAGFLISNCELAYQVRRSTKWGQKISDELFYNYVLPYANLNERVEEWRLDFYNKFYPVVNSAPTF